MFTKSGRKLVPISIQDIIDDAKNCNFKPNIHHNGQVENILDHLLSTDGPMIDFIAEPNPKEDNSPDECDIFLKSLTEHNASKIVANDTLLSKLNHLSTEDTAERVFSRSKIASIQAEAVQLGSNIIDDSIQPSDVVNYVVSTTNTDKTKTNKLSAAHTDQRILSTPSKIISIQTEESQQGSNAFDDNLERMDDAKDYFVQNYVLSSKPYQLPKEHLDEKMPKNLYPAVAVKTPLSSALNQIKKLQQGTNVLDIKEISQFLKDSPTNKAKDTPLVPSISVHRRPQPTQSSKSRKTSAEPPKNKLPIDEIEYIASKSLLRKKVNESRSLLRKKVNDTEYLPYTIETNVIQRERKIQVGSSIKKETRDIAVQFDLMEDKDDNTDEDSKHSQSDWINDIIEEYELIERANMYECHICGEVCPSRASNLKHSLMHTVGWSLLCFRCGRLFPNTSRLLAHENTMHAEKQLEIKRALRCPKMNCVKAFHSKRQLFDHIDHHSTKMTEQRCTRCQRSFATSLQLLCHTNRRNCLR